MGSIFADVVPLDRDVFSIRSGKGNWSALLPEFIQVEFDGLSHVSVHLFAGSSDAYATRQVGNIRQNSPSRFSRLRLRISFQSRLFQDTRKRAGRNIGTKVTGHDYYPLLRGMRIDAVDHSECASAPIRPFRLT